MREVQIGEVRAGDVARSNGREIRVEGDGAFVYGMTPRDLAALGVTFWREERALPDYPGAVVISSDGIRVAVRSRDWGESFVLWMTNAGLSWKTGPELLEWLGPDWWEATTPPASEWVQVDAGQVREGDFVRFEWPDGDAIEGVVAFVAANGHDIEFYEFVDHGIWVVYDVRGQWFKREEQADASE